ncbi:hypothetical protein B0H17DRAFT_1183826 [Mycena rosella]|uniref:Uncharacterized protein n=1 Tax=Mycena rosella TaxID=1033263 RepID=A0AAD7G5Y6_MYCRO|nr:hypothetical protein B0H17DRAFT_1183826 [Mycena rosella]
MPTRCLDGIDRRDLDTPSLNAVTSARLFSSADSRTPLFCGAPASHAHHAEDLPARPFTLIPPRQPCASLRQPRDDRRVLADGGASRSLIKRTAADDPRTSRPTHRFAPPLRFRCKLLHEGNPLVVRAYLVSVWKSFCRVHSLDSGPRRLLFPFFPVADPSRDPSHSWRGRRAKLYVQFWTPRIQHSSVISPSDVVLSAGKSCRLVRNCAPYSVTGVQEGGLVILPFDAGIDHI